MDKKAYRFIGNETNIKGIGRLRRYGQKVMLTDDQAKSIVLAPRGAPCITEALWHRLFGSAKFEVVERGKKTTVDVSYFDTPAKIATAPAEFAAKYAEAAQIYAESIRIGSFPDSKPATNAAEAPPDPTVKKAD